jgi:hypothetical protein
VNIDLNNSSVLGFNYCWVWIALAIGKYFVGFQLKKPPIEPVRLENGPRNRLG